MTLQIEVLFLVLLSLTSALICPDVGICEEGNTCCKNTSGGYGCCPPQNLDVKAVICPDQESECPDDTTCCQLPEGSWGCCPLAKAVCCDDKRHCCPEGTKCDLTHSKCVTSNLESCPMLDKLHARKRRNIKPAGGVTFKTCPGRRSRCPMGSTCCMLIIGDYGCCPYPDGVCCTEGDHCCPSGYICSPHHASCSNGHHSIPWSLKQKTLTKVGTMVADVKCDDKSSCAAGATCCKLPSGDWGCCPLVKAVCCADHEHCCPQGYTCNMQTGTCVKKADQLLLHMLPPSEVVKSQQRNAEKGKDIQCDSLGEFHCPKQETCC